MVVEQYAIRDLGLKDDKRRYTAGHKERQCEKEEVERERWECINVSENLLLNI
jgi:hypothetical protein